MHHYRKSIALFGIVLPLVAAAILVSVCHMLKSKMVASFDSKSQHYKSFKHSQRSALEIEAKASRERQHVERWKALLSEETASAVTSNLRIISEQLPSKEFQQTAFERPSGSGGFGTVSAQKSSQIRIAFRGTFRTMQRMFLELETRMPQLQLEELRIDPSTNQSSLLNFQVSYTAWEN
jgi:hypothetical protein